MAKQVEANSAWRRGNDLLTRNVYGLRFHDAGSDSVGQAGAVAGSP
jgi:hypothetical protein